MSTTFEELAEQGLVIRNATGAKFGGFEPEDEERVLSKLFDRFRAADEVTADLKPTIDSMSPSDLREAPPSFFKELINQADAARFTKSVLGELQETPSKTMELQDPTKGLGERGSGERLV